MREKKRKKRKGVEKEKGSGLVVMKRKGVGTRSYGGSLCWPGVSNNVAWLGVAVVRLCGRPRGLSVLCSPRRWAVSCRHVSFPNGEPRLNDCRNAANSPAVSLALMDSSQPGGRGSGHASSMSEPHPQTRLARLDHGHCSARVTS